MPTLTAVAPTNDAGSSRSLTPSDRLDILQDVITALRGVNALERIDATLKERGAALDAEELLPVGTLASAMCAAALEPIEADARADARAEAARIRQGGAAALVAAE